MFKPEFVKHVPCWASAAFGDIFQPLANALPRIDSCGKIKQPLISGGVLHYSFSFPVYRQNNGPLGSLELPHHLH